PHPPPIHVSMQTGRQDPVTSAGSWHLQTPSMAAALEFAGNDVRIELGEDGHSNRHGASILPDTLRWLWRDYPQPIAVREPPPGSGRGVFAQLVPRRELIPAPAVNCGNARPEPVEGRAAARGSTSSPRAEGAQPPPARGTTGPRGAVYALIYRDKLWQQIGDNGYESVASPAGDQDGNVFFADPSRS